MKQLLGMIWMTLLGMTSIQAQHETLFGRGTSVGGFGAVITETGKINGDVRTSVGGGGGVVVDEFFIGAYGMGSGDYNNLWRGVEPIIDMAHGGFWLGYNYKTFKLLHLYTSARIGWGAIGVDPDRDLFNNREVDGIFVITPEVGVELNVTRWLRIAGSVNYRVVNDIDISNYQNSDFSGLNAGVTFRFGWFGRQKYRDSQG